MRCSSLVRRSCAALMYLVAVASMAAARCDAPTKPAAGKDGKPDTSAPDAFGQVTSAPDADTSKPKAGPRVELEIAQSGKAWGRIIIEFDEKKAPVTTRNFLQYVDEGFYDGTIFHRVIPTFMIQGGGFTGPTEQKAKGLRKPIQNEARNGLKNVRGTIAMARTGEPHSATSQFFINVKDNPNLDYPSSDGWGYCVFGKVVEGMEVVDRIKDVETRPNPAKPREKSMPVNPPVIKKARRVGETAAKRPV